MYGGAVGRGAGFVGARGGCEGGWGEVGVEGVIRFGVGFVRE